MSWGGSEGPDDTRSQSHVKFHHKDVGLLASLMSWSICCFALAILLAFQDKMGAKAGQKTGCTYKAQFSSWTPKCLCHQMKSGGGEQLLQGDSPSLSEVLLEPEEALKEKNTYFY